MAEGVGNIAITVGANVTDFISDMGRASTSVEGFDKKTKNLIVTLAKYASVAAAIGTAKALYTMASENIDRQAKLARAIGTTTSEIQALEYAADLAGIAHEQLAGASAKLNQRLGQAITVGGAAAKELDRLGLSAKELSQMDAGERMGTIADRIVELNYNAPQAAAALKELGLKGNEMVAMMMDGGQQFRDANKELRELNVLVSEVDASKIEASNDAWTKTQMVITGVANTIAVELSPYVQVIAEYLRNAAVESGGFKKQISEAIESGLRGFANLADVVQGLRVVFKGVELVAVGFGAAVVSAVQLVLEGFSILDEAVISTTNMIITAANSLGADIQLIDPFTNSPFMAGVRELGDTTRNKVAEVRAELSELAMQKMPSEEVAKYLDDVKKKATEASQAVVESRKGMIDMPEENEETTKKREKADNIVEGLRGGTDGLRAELAKRQEIIAIYRNNQLAVDAPYYARQLNDIKISEQMKQAEIIAAAQKDDALRAEQQAQNLERVAGDKMASAAIIAEYDAQEILAEQIKQDQITQVQEDAQEARERLRYAERENAISVALGLGQQLMSLVQGQSKRAFEFAKAAAIGSAVIDGYRSAVAAWSAGMSTGGPWAPVVAATYTASSLLKTGGLINSIRGTSFGSGGGGSASSGGGGGGMPAAAVGGGGNGNEQQSGSTYRFEGLSAGSFVSSDMVVEMLKQAKKDGALRGQIEFAA